ncbi:uncharacterized protein LOC124892273 [Capsicum annuum]|uniref:uncharacterized protein LOC124892273 n=1 Tax=Capsicum annuum TaxID=4072 RepID=UPI001FB0EA81|nr:uncharacterized protein LOC124892273 [Capsicum annuum]
MGDCHEAHVNLNIEMIAIVLVPYIEETPRYPIKECQISVLNKYRKTISFVDEWRFKHHKGVNECIFNYVFWTFKSRVDGFRYFRPVISIDGTHVYGKYDIKLLITVGTDGNGSIFPLAFAIAANESLDTRTKFLSDLHQHVVRGREGIMLISDRHHKILRSVSTEHNWQASFAYHRYCLRHLKANYQRAYKSV